MANSFPTDDPSGRQYPTLLDRLVEGVGVLILNALKKGGVFAADRVAAEYLHRFLFMPVPEPQHMMAHNIVTTARRLADPASVAITQALAAMTEIPDVKHRAAKATELLTLISPDVPRGLPGIGTSRPIEAWQREDQFGDQATIVVHFEHDFGHHAMEFVIDHGWGRGFLKDAYGIPGAGLPHRLDQLTPGFYEPPWTGALVPIRTSEALTTIARAFDATLADVEGRYAVEDSLAEAMTLTMVRLRAAGIWHPAVARPFTEEGMRQVAQRFLDSSFGQAITVPREFAFTWAQDIARWGADDELGRPLRAGPWKTEQYLFGRVLKTVPDPIERAKVGEVVWAWNAWRCDQESITGIAAHYLLEITKNMAVDVYTGDTSRYHTLFRDPDDGGASGHSEVSGGGEALDDGVASGGSAAVGDGVVLGEGVDLGDGVAAGEGVDLGDGAAAGDGAAVGDDGAGDSKGPDPDVQVVDWTSDGAELPGTPETIPTRDLDAQRDDSPFGPTENEPARDPGLPGVSGWDLRREAQRYHATTTGTAGLTHEAGAGRPQQDRTGSPGAVPDPWSEPGLSSTFHDPAPAPRGPRRAIVVRADIRGAKPPIWRRLVIPGQARLGELADRLLLAFDWSGQAGHIFTQGRGYSTRWWSDETEEQVFDERRWETQAVLTHIGARLDFTYFVGFGGLEVTMRVERFEDGPCHSFRCLAGRGVAPTEEIFLEDDRPDTFTRIDIASLDEAISHRHLGG